MRSESTGGGLDGLDRSPSVLEVEEDFGAVRVAERLLVGSSVDGDDAERHGGGVLNSEMTESSSCEASDELAGSCGRRAGETHQLQR